MSVTELDTRGLRCPIPIIRLARRAAELPANARIAIVSSDPAAEFDIPAWARMKGHACSAPTITTEPQWEVAFTVTLA